LVAIAKPLFAIVLGEKWLPSVIMFQTLCIAYAITPMHVINHNIMKIKGRSDLFLKTEIIKYIIFTPLLILGAVYGINVLIAGIVLFYWIGFFVNGMYAKRLLNYSVTAQSLDFLPGMGIAFFPALATWSIGYLFQLGNFPLIGIQIVVYSGLVLLLSVAFKIDAYYEIKYILSQKLTVANLVKTITRT
jgi:O-antigen/teichoic acid export membrane protein